MTVVNATDVIMVIRNMKPHLGDALMILAMMKDDDVYAGTEECNALLMNNVKTIPAEQILHWDVDVSNVVYPMWVDYKKAIGAVGWKPPKLIVTKEEVAACKLSDTGRMKIGVCCWSREKHRSYPHWKSLVKKLKKIFDVYVFGNKRLPIRQLVAQIFQMDKLVTVDCGIAHIAGGLNVPLVVIQGPTDCYRLYDCYQDVSYISTDKDRCSRKPCTYTPCKYADCMYLIHPQAIIDVASNDVLRLRQAGQSDLILHLPKYKEAIALLRLDGLGGTVTLSDQAKKVKNKYRLPLTLIIRGYKQLFKDNPNVDEIIEVGATDWYSCLNAMMNRFWAIADIRFAPAKWYGNIEQNFSELQEMYDDFGLGFKGYNELVQNCDIHHIQLTDKTLNLPCETIESEIFSYSDKKVPEYEYICVSSGVDVIHQTQRQTKCWSYWREFVGLCKIPVLQVGTKNDQPIVGAIDMRGKTDIMELCGILKNAKAIVCIEGGIMHLAFALKHPKTIVLRGPTRGKIFEYPGQIMVDSYLCKSCVFAAPDWYLRCYSNADAVCMKSITPERVYENMVKN